MAERLRDTMDSLSKRVSTLGMDEKGIALFDAKKLGASADQLRQIGDAFDVINTYTALAKDNADAEAALKKLKDEAKTLTESLRTPYEAWIDSLDDLDKKLDAGLITYETYVRAINLEGRSCRHRCRRRRIRRASSRSRRPAASRVRWATGW